MNNKIVNLHKFPPINPNFRREGVDENGSDEQFWLRDMDLPSFEEGALKRARKEQQKLRRMPLVNKSQLTPEKHQVHREGKTFLQTKWVDNLRQQGYWYDRADDHHAVDGPRGATTTHWGQDKNGKVLIKHDKERGDTEHDGSGAVVEFIASHLAHQLGVRANKVRFGNVWGQHGEPQLASVHDEIPNAIPYHRNLTPEQLAPMHTLDYIIGNSDRHQGNYLVDDGENVWAIDHGYGALRDPQPTSVINARFDRALESHDYPDRPAFAKAAKETLHKFVTLPDSYFDQLRSLLPEKEDGVANYHPEKGPDQLISFLKDRQAAAADRLLRLHQDYPD